MAPFLTKLLIERNPTIHEEPNKVEKMKMSQNNPPKACNFEKLGKNAMLQN
jgi:hypothetical protein